MAISFSESDVGVELLFTVLNSLGKTFNLTGATVTLLVAGGDSFACTVTSAADGEASYTTAADDFTDGTFNAQIRVVQSGNTYHSEKFTIEVLAEV